ncbi:hypothetical protein PILCRDRAFT_666135 [Piloderma croceum F 1598]|uniref:Ferritin-like domain-containing protein n=1 Tax=Piloderma croceum (strain F 1598) TaxID=765440 RepID=A0A0C3ET30_PILCF|nr:hypothetical protein PILCRDRAFT_666135 [Piloderma croceum F 1598]
MHFPITLVTLVAPLIVSAAPWKRALSSADLQVLKFADLLEQLESRFYTEALAKFQTSDFQEAGFTSGDLPIQQITLIMNDEATHATALGDTIVANGGQVISGCKFNFSSALTDVNTFIATARVVEQVGVGAYLGGTAIISDRAVLQVAGTIATVESRHQTILNALNGANTIPNAFDIPLSPSQVLAIAGGFISGCDVGIPEPVTANAPLTVTNVTGPIQPGTTLSFQSPAINSSIHDNTLFCQIIVGGQNVSTPMPLDQCTVPQNTNGPVVVLITSDSEPLAVSTVDQVTGTTVAGPTVFFVDSVSDLLGKEVRPSMGNSSASAGTSASTS